MSASFFLMSVGLLTLTFVDVVAILADVQLLRQYNMSGSIGR
jgi:hypothetical protein